jgi:hypothetical protein
MGSMMTHPSVQTPLNAASLKGNQKNPERGICLEGFVRKKSMGRDIDAKQANETHQIHCEVE